MRVFVGRFKNRFINRILLPVIMLIQNDVTMFKILSWGGNNNNINNESGITIYI